MSKKGENIYKRKDGRWEGRYIRCRSEHGKARYGYVYAKTYSEVRRKLTEKKSYTGAMLSCTSHCNASYSEVLSLWLLSIAPTVKESTHARYSSLVHTHILPHLGKFQISKITNQMIEMFLDLKLSNGRVDGRGGLSSKTVSDILTVIKASIEYARKANIAVICTPHEISIKHKVREMRVLHKSEQKALLNTLITDMDLFKFGVLLSLHTGIRLGELCALKWSDFDLETSVLKIQRTLQRIQSMDGASKTKVIITAPKTSCSVREIPLPMFLCDIADRFSSAPSSYVLTGETDRFVEPRTMQNHFKSILKQSGLSGVNFHALRHTFATRCVEVGFELKALSEILGHSSVNITLNKYVHTSFEAKKENMEKLYF